MNEMLKHKITVLPKDSGVYIMKDKSGNVIYVGKAKNLKNRVSQYFQNSVKHEKVKLMVENIEDMEYYVVPSEYDAFVLERNLIAKYQPFFNILLKDGKQYPYLKLDMSNSFPKLEVVRKIKNDNSKYFGPFLFPVKAEELIEIVNYAYPLRNCSIKINLDKPIKKACLNYDLGLCSAPCICKVTKQEYHEIVKKVIRFLNGDSKDIAKILKNKMQIAADAENFETALNLKHKLEMVEKLDSKVITQLTNMSHYDVFGVYADGAFISTCVMQIRSGKILNVECFNLINISENKSEILQNFICDFYSQQVIPAKEILVSCDVNNSVLEEFFKNVKGENINIVSPQKSIKRHLVDMAVENAKSYVERSISKNQKTLARTIGAVERLKDKLNLTQSPNRIECYDISHLGGTETVGSMVVFINGEKATKLYRKFKINSVEGINDYASLQEVLRRRVDEYKNSKDISFSQKPNLIVIDGGKGQLNSCYEIIKNEQFNVEIISLAEKFDEVFSLKSSMPVVLNRGSVELSLLQSIRDEAHRFAITYQTNNKLKHTLKSPLLEVSGIGEVAAKNLTKQYRTLAVMASLDKSMLLKVKGVNKGNIDALYEFLQKHK